jgi:asparagine synthase (glutamine-hydrolysing)
MCGIAGKIYFNKGGNKERDLLLMAKKIAYRGPDDQGIYINEDKTVGLVNLRLAVQDLSAKGHMPMSFQDKYVITYNGEIYNFGQQRKYLEKDGYKFKSHSDTEVILALYDKYGIKCLDRLRGMFAFAIYDRVNQRIFLARDRIGKKPLKYFVNSEVFIFASELKAILTQKEVHAAPDFLAIHHYLTYGYTPAPLTGFEGIQKLEPGHYMTLDLTTNTVTKKKYWEPDFSAKLDLSEKEWCDRIVRELEDSTRIRMVADVPVGAFLSGGVDSSAVVAMMARNSKKPIKTFTIAFKEEEYNETEYAKNIADMYKTEHTVLEANPEDVELLPQLAYQYEEPFADASAVVTYMVSKLARQYVTVILNGDGGDENFAGYDRYRRLKRDAIVDSLWFAHPFMHFAARHIESQNPWLSRIDRFLEKAKLPLADRFVSYNSYFLNADKEKLYSPRHPELVSGSDSLTGTEQRRMLKQVQHDVNSYSIYQDKFLSSHALDPRDAALYADLTTYLPDDLLAKVDIASMSNSLEARSPLLDHQFIELAYKIDFDLKVKGYGKNTEFKYIFKKALEGIVPNENLYRPKKGFSIPLSKWFSGDLNKYAESILLNKNTHTKKLFNQQEIKRMLKSHSEETDFGPKLWSLLTLELWWKQYFK